MKFPTDSTFPISSDTDSESSSDNDTLNYFVSVYNELDAESSRPKKKMVDRDRIRANEVLMNDYFVENPLYNAETFRDRFRLPKELFLKIVGDIEASEEWFQERYDARGKPSFTPIQKCTSAIRQLATGNPPDQYDEYLAMSERTSRECLQFFCNAVIKLYANEFLRKPTSHDISRIYAAHEARWHFPGMLGSIDCTHIEWKNCPRELRGAYVRGDIKRPTIILEAVTSNDLWIWHSYSVFQAFKKLQESARKDVERAFGVLKGRWGILHRPVRSMTKKSIHSIVYACIILHNMLIKHDGRAISPDWVPDPPTQVQVPQDIHLQLRNEETHFRLRFDLIELVGSLGLEFPDSDEEFRIRRFTTEDEIDKVVELTVNQVEKSKEMSPLYEMLRKSSISKIYYGLNTSSIRVYRRDAGLY
uniref:Putative harbinger transposase-derived protein n=1 Tax=Helianthus annuus TaxID=4232 RepID=A0A251UEE0_HELAN